MHRLFLFALLLLGPAGRAVADLPRRALTLDAGSPALLVAPPASLLPQESDTTRYEACWTLRPDGGRTLLAITALLPRTQADVKYCSALFQRWMAEHGQYYDFLRASWFTGTLTTIDQPEAMPDGTWTSPRRTRYRFEHGVLTGREVVADSLGSLLGAKKAACTTPAELAHAEMQALEAALVKAFAPYKSRRTDRPLTLLIVDRDGHLDARAVPDATGERPSDGDALAFQQLRAALASLPAGALACLFTEQGAPYAGRLVRANLNDGRWRLTDHFEPAFTAVPAPPQRRTWWPWAAGAAAIAVAAVAAAALRRRKH